MIVTIDGPAGSGKSTAARGLARRLGFDYIDTGAMYRAVAHACLQAGIDATDAVPVTEQAARLQVGFDGPNVLLDGVGIHEPKGIPGKILHLQDLWYKFTGIHGFP